MTGALDRRRGALLGLAVGDALGAPVEFTARGSFPPVTDMQAGGWFDLKPGQWTDDTSMALCLAESLVERGRLDPVDQLGRYVRWWQDGHLSSTGVGFGLGDQTRLALRTFHETGSPCPLAGDEEGQGNGSIMRLAPVAVAYSHEGIDAAQRASGESSLTTHPSRACVDACRLLGGMIAAATHGQAKIDVLDSGFWQWGNLHEDIARIADGSYRDKEPPEIRGGGWVVHSLEAALWAVWTTDSFDAAVLAAVNLGDDADTTGAVAGQLAGALYGADAIPARWRRGIAHADLVAGFADWLAAGCLTGVS